MVKQLFLLVLAVALGVGPVWAQPSADEIMAQAAEAYAATDYGVALALYDALLEAGVRHSSLYMNTGHTYLQQGELGRAMLYYRRAQQLIPRDPQLAASIARVRADRIDVQGDEVNLLDNIASSTAGLLSNVELAWLGLGAWTLWFGVLVLARVIPSQRLTLRAPAIALGVVVLALVVLVSSRLVVNRLRAPAVIVVEEAPALSGPGEVYLELFDVHDGAEVRVLERAQGWARVLLPDGRQGWVTTDSVDEV